MEQTLMGMRTTLERLNLAWERQQAEQQRLQEEIANIGPSLRAEFAELRDRPPPSPSEAPSREPKISLPTKFDGTRSEFRGFLNQVKLRMVMLPLRYPDDVMKVGLIGSLLSGAALTWFASLLERNDPVLGDFTGFEQLFTNMFSDTDRQRSAINKLRVLRQGNKTAAAYAAEFQMIAVDLAWGDQALREHFRTGLREDVKDLLLGQPDPDSLVSAIDLAVRCDNRLQERRLERRGVEVPKAPAVPVLDSPVLVHGGPAPMETDPSRRRHLTPAERLRRINGHLCLYCADPHHELSNCPRKPFARLPPPRQARVVDLSGNEDDQSE